MKRILFAFLLALPSALIAASEDLQCCNLTLVAFAQTRDVEIEGKVIHVKSALDWLLEERRITF